MARSTSRTTLADESSASATTTKFSAREFPRLAARARVPCPCPCPMPRAPCPCPCPCPCPNLISPDPIRRWSRAQRARRNADGKRERLGGRQRKSGTGHGHGHGHGHGQ